MTFETDITGYGRKMGRDAGISAEGKLDGVHKCDGTWFPERTISARTMNPSNTESSGGGLMVGNYWSQPRSISQDVIQPGETEKWTIKTRHPELNDSNYPV